MAIVDNFWLKGSRKRLAGAVIYEAMGQTRSRRLAASVSNPRTEAQMTQRIRWSNAVSFYRANASWMKYAYETKKANQSEYNKFMSVNVTTSPIALTKSAAAAGACVVAPYIVTQGSLPSIEWQDTGNTLKSNIYLGPTKTMEQYITVGDFARDLILYNPAMREGDQLSLIRFSQLTNAATGFPYVVVRKYEVLLDSTSTAPLANYIPADYIQVPGLAENNAISVAKGNRQGGFTMILSRTSAGKTYVSTQSVVIVNNETLINQYSSPEAIAAAITSYGDSADAFLSTTSAQQASTQPVTLTINYITIGDTTYRPGAQTPKGSEMVNKTVTAWFSADVPDSSNIFSKFRFLGSSKAEDGNQPTVRYNSINLGALQAVQEVNLDEHLSSLTITIDSTEYRINFALASEYGSME